MIYKTIVALSLVASASALFYTEDVNAQLSMFEDFKVKFGRKYSSVEEEKSKFLKFVENLKVIDERNALELAIPGGEACHGITKFADMSQTEFQELYLSPDMKIEPYEDMKVDVWDGSEFPDEHLKSGITNVNWNYYVTTPNDQGICRNSYAFAAMQQVETDYFIKYMNVSEDVPMYSAQQITSCCRNCDGCYGGTVVGSWAYIKNTGGIETMPDYPYLSGNTGNQEACTSNSSKYQVYTNGYTVITNTESNMKSYIVNKGPFVVYVDSSTWSTYTNGTLSACGTTPTQYAQVVGLYIPADTSQGYWNVRTSVGSTWGMNGYIRLKWNNNTCNITASTTSVTNNVFPK